MRVETSTFPNECHHNRILGNEPMCSYPPPPRVQRNPSDLPISPAPEGGPVGPPPPATLAHRVRQQAEASVGRAHVVCGERAVRTIKTLTSVCQGLLSIPSRPFGYDQV